MAGAVQVKAFTLRQAILQGWRERWPDFQWALNLKKFFPKANSWDVLGLADHLLEQAMIGPAPNSILLSYLKYAINSQMVSYSNLILAITKFEDFSRDYCVIALLELIENICPHLSCYGKAEECMSLCRALLSCLLWLLQCITHCLDRIHMAQAPQTSEPLPTVLPTAPPPLGLLPSCASALEKVLGGARNRAFLHIARLEEQSIWSLVEQTTWKIPEFLNSIGCPDDVKRRLEECTMVIKRIPSLLLLGEEQSTHVEFPTIQALITLEGTTNLTAEGQPLVEHLLIVKRVQHIPMRFMLLEIWKACMVGLIESPEGIEELKWTAFTFLKMPQVLLKLKKFHQGDKDFNDELNLALESLVKLTPLLDKADHRCNCDCFQLILQECGKFGILSESHNQKLVAFRTTDRDQIPQAKSPENSNVQPNPMLILRAEPTVTNILKTMEGDHSKCVEGLLGVLGHMLTGKSLDLLLAAGAAGRKLKSFARKFSKLNEYAKHGSGESTKASQVRALFFDISFLMLCHITQLYGSEVITSDPVIGGEPTFFESWMQLCMPEEGKSLNPDHVLRVEPGKVEVLLSHLNSSIEMKLTQVKWHEVCASLPGVMSEVLNAWELGLLNMEAVQKITDNLKGRLCSLAVCAVAWLVSHIRVLGLEEREKPLQLIQLLVTPVAGEPTMQFYSERVAIMSSIIERMCTEVMQQTGTRIKFQGNSPADGSHCRDLLPGTHPIRELLQSAFASAMTRGLLDTRALLTLEAVMHTGGTHWFTDNLIKELLKETRKDCADRAVELLYGVFSLDLHQLTLSLLGHVLPPLLTTPAKWHCLTAPPGRALARLAVWCAITSYSTHSRSQISAKYRKRPREDVEDYISLFPLDDTQPSKLLRLLSSNDEDNNTLSSPGDRSMSSSLSASQLHNVNVKEPLNRVLANFFLLLSSTLTLKTVGPQTQFVQWFVQECVDCERGSRGSILHFMPFTMISELTKLPGMANPRLILAITDLGLPLGRRVAAKAIAAF